MRAAAWCAALLLTAAATAEGQARPSWSAGARLAESSTGPLDPAIWLGGRFEWNRSGLWLDASGAAGRGWRGRLGGEAAIAGALRTGGPGGLAETRFDAAIEHPIGRETAAELDWRAGVGRRFGPVELTLGALAVGRAAATRSAFGGGFLATRVVVGPVELRGDVGQVALLGGSLASPVLGAASPLDDTLATGNPTEGDQSGPRRVRRLAHAMVGATLQRGWLELSAVALRRTRVELGQSLGWQLGVGVGPFGGARLVVAGGRMPGGRTVYLPYRKQLTIGLELRQPRRRFERALAPAATATFELRADRAGSRIVIRHPAAARVEIAGDFSDWEPLLLTSVGPGRFEATLGLAPGTHQINVRFDGGLWEVPAGLGSAPDEFGGRVGVLIVRP